MAAIGNAQDQGTDSNETPRNELERVDEHQHLYLASRLTARRGGHLGRHVYRVGVDVCVSGVQSWRMISGYAVGSGQTPACESRYAMPSASGYVSV